MKSSWLMLTGVLPSFAIICFLANALAGVMRHNLAAHMLHDPARIDALAVQVHTAACLNTRFYSKAYGAVWTA